jgi:hypothetical protein
VPATIVSPGIGYAIASRFQRWEQLHPSRFYPIYFIVSLEVAELFASVRLIGHFGILAIKSAVR